MKLSEEIVSYVLTKQDEEDFRELVVNVDKIIKERSKQFADDLAKALFGDQK